jgi:hypothetical protein
MSYVYELEKPWLLTDEGQRCLMKARDQAGELLKLAGAFMAVSVLKGVPYGDTWKALAILDRLVELGIIREVTCGCGGLDRVFVSV